MVIITGPERTAAKLTYRKAYKIASVCQVVQFRYSDNWNYDTNKGEDGLFTKKIAESIGMFKTDTGWEINTPNDGPRMVHDGDWIVKDDNKIIIMPNDLFEARYKIIYELDEEF